MASGLTFDMEIAAIPVPVARAPFVTPPTVVGAVTGGAEIIPASAHCIVFAGLRHWAREFKPRGSIHC